MFLRPRFFQFSLHLLLHCRHLLSLLRCRLESDQTPVLRRSGMDCLAVWPVRSQTRTQSQLLTTLQRKTQTRQGVSEDLQSVLCTDMAWLEAKHSEVGVEVFETRTGRSVSCSVRHRWQKNNGWQAAGVGLNVESLSPKFLNMDQLAGRLGKVRPRERHLLRRAFDLDVDQADVSRPEKKRVNQPWLALRRRGRFCKGRSRWRRRSMYRTSKGVCPQRRRKKEERRKKKEERRKKKEERRKKKEERRKKNEERRKKKEERRKKKEERRKKKEERRKKKKVDSQVR